MEHDIWHWQEPGEVWKGVGIYHITMVVSSRKPLLGELVIPANDPEQAHVVLSAFGEEIKDCVKTIPDFHPEIQILALRMMPDHVHFILHVRRKMDIGIRAAMRGFWQAAKSIGRAYTSSIDPDGNKLTGQSILGQVNSGSIKAQAIFDDAVLYPNPYVVVTSKGYTKHYYAGTERIATVIGTGGFDDMVYAIDKLSSPHDQDIIKTFYSYYQNYDPFFYQKIVSQPEKTEDIFGKPSSDLEYQCKPTELVMVDILNPPDILFKSISVNEQNNGPEKEVYFYHGDHLGSANWITDYTGAPIQYIHYAPYGELIDNQVPYGYDERYKFTGKERDEETGYDYFGARYYWQAGTWLSVDPLAGDYPQISPYAYAAWNPIRFIDPDGREITITGEDGVTITYVPGGKYEGNDSFTMKMWSQLDEIYSTESGGIVLNELVNDKGKAFNVNSQLAKGPNGLDVKGYIPGKRLLRMGGEVQGTEALAHEFFHAYQDLHGYGGASCANDVEAYLFQGLVYSELYGGVSFGAFSTFELQPIDNQSMYFNTYVDIMTDGMLNTDRLNNLANGFSAYSRAGANGIAENYTTFSKNQQYRILNFWRR